MITGRLPLGMEGFKVADYGTVEGEGDGAGASADGAADGGAGGDAPKEADGVEGKPSMAKSFSLSKMRRKSRSSSPTFSRLATFSVASFLFL